MKWFTETVWILPNWSWIIIALAAIAVIAVIIIAITSACKKRGKKDSAVKTAAPAWKENTSEKTPVEKSEEKPEEKVEKRAEKPAEPKTKTQPAAKPKAKAEKPEPAEDTKEDDASAEKQAEKPDVKKNKVYHISKRKDDGRWQVKAAGGSKAIKIFRTQAEAIDYAKTLAENQEARIVIHKEDGSFRRLTYKK